MILSFENLFIVFTVSLLSVADEMHLTAIVTLLDSMMLHELIPVVPLTRREHTRSTAHRTGTVERCQDRLPYKGGSVGDPLHRLEQVSVSLECDDFVISLHASLLQPNGITQ